MGSTLMAHATERDSVRFVQRRMGREPAWGVSFRLGPMALRTMVLLLVMRTSVSKRLARLLQQRIMVDALTGVLRPWAFWRQAGTLTRQLST